MSTRQESCQQLNWRLGPDRLGASDPSEVVALVARSRRDLLLSAHRHRLRMEDLEDCYSQASLEMVIRSRREGSFASRAHMANALEQRFLSRIQDRRRALGGRSPMEAAIAGALPLAGCEENGVEILDQNADVEHLILLRSDLRLIGKVWPCLSSDQRLVLVAELSDEAGCVEFCRKHGWSVGKYRKVSRRARVKLTQLLAAQAEARTFISAGDLCPALT